VFSEYMRNIGWVVRLIAIGFLPEPIYLLLAIRIINLCPNFKYHSNKHKKRGL